VSTPAVTVWLTVGQGGNNIGYSMDGVTWTGIAGSGTVCPSGRSIAYNSSTGQLLACSAYASSSNCMAYSMNGFNWTIVPGLNLLGGYAFSVIYANNIWVTIGGNGAGFAAYSTNSFNWTVTAPSSIVSNNFGQGIAYGKNLWVATALGGPNTLVYSTNAITWTGLGNSVFSGIGAGCGSTILYNSTKQIFVLQGTGQSSSGSFGYSTDGTTWTATSPNIFTSSGGIGYGNNMYVGVGYGTSNVAYSNNAVNWTGLGKVFGTNIQGFGAAYSASQGIWVACGQAGNGNAIIYSTNASTGRELPCNPHCKPVFTNWAVCL